MQKILSFLLFVLLASAVPVLAQNAELQGKVTDEKGEPVPFANVMIQMGGSPVGAQTDFDGFYSIKPITPGTYDVRFSYVGLQEQLIQGVVVNSDKITFLNAQLVAKTEMLKEVQIVSYKVPLLKADETATGGTLTKEDIKNLPTRNAASIASQAAGVYQKDEGGGLNVKGSRDNATDYYIDGVRVRGSSALPASAIEQLTVVTGGVPARYGDATGGIINITTSGPSKKFAGGVTLESSKFLDAYGYHLANLSLSGPLLKKAKGTDNERTLLGFFLSTEYQHNDDDSPSAVGIYRAKKSVLDSLSRYPLVKSPIAETYVTQTQYIRASDLEKIKAKTNVDRDQISLAAKLQFQPVSNINVILGGTLNYDQGGYGRRSSGTKAFMRRNELFNPSHMPEINNFVYRGYVRFTQRFANKQLDATETAENRTKPSLFQNLYYAVQFDYTKDKLTAQDPMFKDRLFDYGYVGKYETFYKPNYAINNVKYGEGNNAITFTGWEFGGYQDTLVKVTPNTTINPEKGYYMEHYNALSAGKENFYLANDLAIRSNGGILNGGGLPLVYSMWAQPGSIYDVYRKNDNDQYRLTFNGSFDIKPPGSSDRNKHAIEFGFEYEQTIERDHTINPQGLWGLMNNRTARYERDFVRDIANPMLVINGQTYSISDYLAQAQNGGLIFSANDTITYQYIRNSTQTFFDKQLRKKLGIGEFDRIDVDQLDPSTFDLGMFSPNELFQQGDALIDYYGTDYTGKKLTKQPAFADFWKDYDTNLGIFTRPQAAFQPIYTAGYIQDKFAFKDLIFNVGLRVDRFDANQKAPKDLYSPLYGVRKVGEVTKIGNTDVNHPTNMADDYVVYVDDPVKPNAIKGYRDGDQWYDANGNPTTARKLGVVNPYLYDLPASYAGDPKNFVKADSLYNPEQAFQDYKPQINLMPRIAFSFEISDEAIFFAHYDVLTQRPPGRNRTSPYSYYYFAEEAVDNEFENPNLRPEKTVDYQIGFKQKLTESSALTLSGFYRELKDLVQQYRVLNAYPSEYTTYRNVDFGTVKGFEVAYDLRRTKNLRMGINYTMQFADGTGSGDGTQQNIVSQLGENLKNVLPLDYDSRHLLNINLDYSFAEGADYNGPKIGGKNILENFGVNLILRTRSGEPYSRIQDAVPEGLLGVATRSQLDGSVNGSRLPWNFRLDARVEKAFKVGFGKNRAKSNKYINLYLYSQNLLNTLNINSVYKYTGSASDDGYINSALGQDQANNSPSPASFKELYALRINNPNNFSLPRVIRLGVQFDF